MQNSAPHPPTAAQWEAVLAFRDLPILSETRDALRRELKNPQVSFESLVPIAESDPALCWHLLQSAVTQNPECREQIHGAYNCLSLLGMQELVQLVKQLPVIDKRSEDSSEVVYRQALYTAHMAGCLAAQWASAKGTPTSTAYWSAMLANSVLWPWLLLDKSSHKWLHLISEGDDITTASRKVFGHSPDNWKRLVRRHNLPEPVAGIFQRDTLPDRAHWRRLRRQDPRDSASDRKLVHQSQSASMLTLTAAGAAWHLHVNPEGERSQRWLALSSHAQGRQYPVLVSESRQVQLDEARLRMSPLASGIALLATPRPEAMPYAEWLPLPEHPTVPVSQAAVAEQPQARHQTQPERVPERETQRTQKPAPEHDQNTAASSAPAHHGNAYLSKLMGQLAESPASFGDWHYLMQGVLKGIHLGIGVAHAIVMLPNKDKTAIRTVYSENPDGLSALNQKPVALQTAPLLKQLMKQPAAVHVSAATRERYFKGMNADLTAALPSDVVMMSVHAGRSPIGVVVAANSDGTPITKEQYKRFRQLCTTTSQGLASLRQLSAQQNKATQKKPIRHTS